jgi:membrane-associated phospholipid phosphatase
MVPMLIAFLRKHPWFYLPFLIWMVLGGVLLLSFTQEQLFFAINARHSDFFDRLMPAISAYGRGDCISIVLISLILIPALRHKWYIITAIVFGILISVPIYFLKLCYGCPRPISVYGLERVHTVSWLENLHNNSFPSGHTIGAFGFFLFVSFWLPLQHRRWAFVFFLLALLVGVSRLYLGQHFFKDIYYGSLIGVSICTLIYLAGTYYFQPKSLHS